MAEIALDCPRVVAIICELVAARVAEHRDIEVTDAEGEDRPLVSQAFCSALPVA
jgi:hypothetical protein